MRISNNKLVKNTLALYILTFSSQLINIILIPYETRVLGASTYGVLSLGVSLSIIFGLIFDFGFILSATEEVASGERTSEALSRIVSEVSILKIAIILAVGVLTIPAYLTIEPFCSNQNLFVLYYFAYAINALLPDYIYRGLEDMKAVTIRTVAVRVLFSLPIFFVVKDSQSVWLIPAFLLCGNFAAVVYSLFDLNKRYDIRYLRPPLNEVNRLFKKSLPFFISRFASTFYQSMNSVILGVIYPGQPVVGNYGAAEKFLSVVKQCSSPIADSVFPYMVRTKNYKVCWRLLRISAPLIVLLALIAFINADFICALAFGAEYVQSGSLLRALLPAIMVIFPTYIICFPMLVPMGLSEKANFSNVIGAVCQIVCLALLLITNNLNAITLCLSSSCSEVAVFIYRFIILLKNRYRCSTLS